MKKDQGSACVLILSRSEPTALQELHPGAAELSCVRMSTKVSRPSRMFYWSSSGEPRWTTLYIILYSLFWINACIQSSAFGDHVSGNWIFGETPFHCQLDKITSHVGERIPRCLTAQCTYTLPCLLLMCTTTILWPTKPHSSHLTVASVYCFPLFKT